MTDYTASFLRVAKTYPEFGEALDIIRKNSDGKAWLIGGFVCRAIIQDMYGIQMSKEVDLDFIVKHPVPKLNLPAGWRVKLNSYGNPKFVGPSYEIDYVPLHNVHSIQRRGLAPTIENFLLGTPLNVQSIAFDIEKNEVIGEIGIRSIKERIVSINDLEQAKHRAEKKGTTLKGLVDDIAGQFDFAAAHGEREKV